MAEAVPGKGRTAARAWWGVIALAGFVVALACTVAMPRRVQAATRPSSPPAERDRRQRAATTDQRNDPTTAFEPTDWSLRPVALIYVAIPVLLVISCFVLIVAYPNAMPDADRTLHIAPPGPRLQIDAEGDLQRFRADTERRLSTYYWIDKKQGIVHIPIDQAMKKLATTGAPGFPKVPQ